MWRNAGENQRRKNKNKKITKRFLTNRKSADEWLTPSRRSQAAQTHRQAETIPIERFGAAQHTIHHSICLSIIDLCVPVQWHRREIHSFSNVQCSSVWPVRILLKGNNDNNNNDFENNQQIFLSRLFFFRNSMEQKGNNKIQVEKSYQPHKNLSPSIIFVLEYTHSRVYKTSQ